MSIIETIRSGLRIAWTSRSLWLFGFFLGLSGSGGNGGGGGQGGQQPGAPVPGGLLMSLAVMGILIFAAFIAMHVLSEGALIEGVSRAQRGETLRVSDGFREGSAHWSTVLLLDVIYLLVCAVSIAILAAPSVIAVSAGAPAAAIGLAIPAALIGIPWLLTLYMWQAFATRIAVLENRRVTDAIRKARLFLHGRIWHGLKLMIASLLGTAFATLVAALVIVPFGLLIPLAFALGAGPIAIVVGAVLLAPAFIVAVAIIGTFRSSVWTIGYLSEIEAAS